ncbi:MAG: UbiX family flavin prenyltransferase [Nocardioidaceae bacterium]
MEDRQEGMAGASTRRLLVGISGATGVTYGVRLLEVLQRVADVETHLIMSPSARQTLQLEMDWKPREVEARADVVYRFSDVAAAPSSGSYRTMGMVVAPCSMGSVSGIANSANDNLLVRAADVTLKERRPLVLLPRETPLHLGHLRLLVRVAEIGAVVAPPLPAFYQRPQSLEQVVDHTVMRVLDLFDIEPPVPLSRRWGGRESAAPSDLTEPLFVGDTYEPGDGR